MEVRGTGPTFNLSWESYISVISARIFDQEDDEGAATGMVVTGLPVSVAHDFSLKVSSF